MSLVGKVIYHFEDIEIDASQGCVKRSGEEQYLRQQAFQLLLFLLEQRERLVTKDELIKNIWHKTAVTDNALVQCIVDIRKALGDDPRHPRFIKTIPKVGYRFIGPVEEHMVSDLPSHPPGSLPSASEEIDEKDRSFPSDPEHKAVTAPAENAWLSKKVAIAFLLAVLLIVSIALFVRFQPSAKQHTEVTLPQVPGKKRLAVMYFENRSASAKLDWLREGLADMLITDLARSSKLTVLSRQQLHILIERIGHKPTDKIQLNDALDVAKRSHAEAVVLGSFAALDEQIRIDIQLHDVENGQILAADRLVVDKLGDIFTQVDILSLKLAAHLGIDPSDPDKNSGIASVMTNNLEAYRYYSLGVEKMQAYENAEAIKLMERAIKLDPQFAMAYARIGFAYTVTDFFPEKSRPYLEKAFQLSDRLTEKDRFYITAWYAIAQLDYPRAVQTYRQIVAQYPLEIEAYRRLGRLLLGEEQAEEAVEVIKQGLAIDPEAKGLYNGIGVVYLGLGRYDEAIAAHQRYVALAPEEPNAHDSLGMSYQQSGRYSEAIAEYSKALELNSRFEPAIIHLGDVYFQQGRYREAISQYQRYIQVTQFDLARALGYSNIAYVYWRKGDLRQAEQAAQSEIKYEKRAVWNALVLALERSEGAKVEKLKEKLFERLPYPQRGARHDLRSYDYYRGYLALRAGRSAEAIAHFKEALRHLPPTSGIDLYEDCLANAYLLLGQLDEAISEYQRILNLNPNYPLAHYYLGQAYERKGDYEQARVSYQRFLEIWKGADPDIPEVVQVTNALPVLMSR